MLDFSFVPKQGRLRQTLCAFVMREVLPLLGEHTSKVLQELGYSLEEIKSLLTRRVIR